jgi:hypothetical protein
MITINLQEIIERLNNTKDQVQISVPYRKPVQVSIGSDSFQVNGERKTVLEALGS